MKTFLTVNIITKVATEGGSDWTPPTFGFGETLHLALKFTQEIGGTLTDPKLDIRAMRAALGDVDARPEAGRWALQAGGGAQTADNTTGLLGYNATAGEVAAALNAKSAIVTAHGAAVVTKDDDTWSIVFGSGATEVPVQVRDNTLFPISFGHVDAYAVDGAWRQCVRMIVAPLAFSDGGEEVLPNPPAVTPLIDGQGAGVLRWNEVQKLTVPLNFTGTYRLKFLDQYTQHLTTADNASSLQSALIEAFGDSFKVTDGEPGVAFIQFIEDFEESDQPLIVAEVVSAAPRDLTFTLPLTQAELAVRLRRDSAVTLPLEVRVQVADEDENLTWLVVLRQELTIQRPVSWPEMALVPGIDWLRPPSPRNYVPFNPETVITGQQYYPLAVGDGVSEEWTLTHGLDTEVVFVFGRENSAGGRQLVQGTDFDVTIDSADAVTVSALTGPPAATAWLLVVMSAQTVGAFAAGLEIEIGQVTGLQALLDGFSTTIAQFRTLIPNVTPGAQVSGGAALVIPLTERKELYPGVWKEETNLKDPRLKGKRLLPAIHDATVTSFAALPLPTATAANGSVYQNDTAAALILPGGSVPVGGYFGSDGQALYGLSRSGTSASYFPAPMERELWRIEISPEMLRTGKKLDVKAELLIRTAGANADLQARLVVEWGNIVSQSAPVGAAITLTDNGTGTHTLSRETGVVGTFTVVFGTGVFTLADHDLSDGEVVTATNAGGALPDGMAAATGYVVRDVAGDTFKLALLTTAENLEDIDWQAATPLLSHRLILAPTQQPHSYGVKLSRSIAGLTATRTLYGGELGVAVAPPLARFGLRARLINIDTRNPVAAPRGLIYYESRGTASI